MNKTLVFTAAFMIVSAALAENKAVLPGEAHFLSEAQKQEFLNNISRVILGYQERRAARDLKSLLIKKDSGYQTGIFDTNGIPTFVLIEAEGGDEDKNSPSALDRIYDDIEALTPKLKTGVRVCGASWQAGNERRLIYYVPFKSGSVDRYDKVLFAVLPANEKASPSGAAPLEKKTETPKTIDKAEFRSELIKKEFLADIEDIIRDYQAKRTEDMNYSVLSARRAGYAAGVCDFGAKADIVSVAVTEPKADYQIVQDEIMARVKRDIERAMPLLSAGQNVWGSRWQSGDEIKVIYYVPFQSVPGKNHDRIFFAALKIKQDKKVK